jgi:hypothetical protein
LKALLELETLQKFKVVGLTQKCETYADDKAFDKLIFLSVKTDTVQLDKETFANLELFNHM